MPFEDYTIRQAKFLERWEELFLGCSNTFSTLSRPVCTDGGVLLSGQQWEMSPWNEALGPERAPEIKQI